MKKYLVVALVAAGLFLTACGAGTSTVTVTATSTETYTAPAPIPTEPTVVDKEALFLDVVQNSGVTWLEQASPSQLLDLAYQTCQILDSGYTVDELVTALAQGFVADGFDNDPELYEGTGILIGASVAAFCPQYGNQF